MKIVYFLISLFFFKNSNGYYNLLRKILDKPSRTIFDRLHFFKRKPVNTIKKIKNTKDVKDTKKIRIRVNSTMNEENKYNLNWYVIGESSEFKKNKIQQVKIWNKKYAVWRENDKQLSAMDNHCSHRGASLSLGELTYVNKESRIVCPYHGYEFNREGVLCKIPGLNFTNSQCHNQLVYPIFEQDGWVYMNIIPSIYTENVEFSKNEIYREPESFNESFSRIQINTDFQAPARIVSENSLDVMHIGFVHTFGNKINPNPIREVPPFLPNETNQLHYKTIYDYNSGEDSIAKKIYKFDKLLIENEFILPHTTVARIIFGDLTSTVITFALPQNDTHSRLFVKTYRNYWNTKDTTYLGDLNNYLGDSFTRYTMEKTVKQDKSVVENIEPEHMNGKYNMMYDKLQNVYRSMYKKYVKNGSTDME
jgi:phenylpropionate dioxygenase-like ring-hydroxylating dioxygenase large terminal subunit